MKVRIESFEDLRDNEKFSFIARGTGTEYMGYQVKEIRSDYMLVYNDVDTRKSTRTVIDIQPDIFYTYYIEVERDDKIKYRNS